MELLDELNLPINLVDKITDIKCAYFKYYCRNVVINEEILLKVGFVENDLNQFIKDINSIVGYDLERDTCILFNIWLKNGACYELYYNWDGWRGYRWHYHEIPPIPSELLPKIDLPYLVKKE